MVRVKPGAEVGQPAGGGDDHPIAVPLEHIRQPLEEGRKPGLQRRAELFGRALARAQGGAALDQRVQPANGFGHGLEHQAFAQTIGRDHHLGQAEPLHQTLQHQGGVGKGVGALLGDARDPLKRAARLARHETRGVQHLARPDLVLVHDPQRVVGQAHVQQGDVSPGPADGVEAAPRVVPAEPPDRLGHRCTHPGGVDVARRARTQRERAQGQRHAKARLALVQRDEFEAEPAEVADQTVGARTAGAYAQSREPRLLTSREHAQRQPRLVERPPHEGRTVFGLAHRGGRRQVDFVRLHPVQHRAEPSERRQGGLGPFARKAAGLGQVAAEPG